MIDYRIKPKDGSLVYHSSEREHDRDPFECDRCGNQILRDCVDDDGLCDLCKLEEHMQRMIDHAEEQRSREEAMAEYQQHKEKREKEQEQEECPHDEHDHGICLDCGLDIMDDLIGRSEMMEDR